MPRSPTYSPPTLAEMRTLVARTLRDEQQTVFGTDAINDFIAEGLMSLGGYRPIEAIETASYEPVTYGDTQFIQPQILTSVWQVVATNPADPTAVNQAYVLPYTSVDNPSVQIGWDFYSGALWFGRWVVNQMDAWFGHIGAPLSIVMYGYRDRTIPGSEDAEVLDLEDAIDQLCLTRECRALGFQLLNNDRALYQQWLAATNNTDVSPTQIQGMLSNAVGDVERQRKRSATYRRIPSTGPQYL